MPPVSNTIQTIEPVEQTFAQFMNMITHGPFGRLRISSDNGGHDPFVFLSAGGQTGRVGLGVNIG
jgi:hypothetical protein